MERITTLESNGNNKGIAECLAGKYIKRDESFCFEFDFSNTNTKHLFPVDMFMYPPNLLQWGNGTKPIEPAEDSFGNIVWFAFGAERSGNA